MTVFSKANLQVVSLASGDAFDRGLHGVRFEPDGSTVAGNKRMMMAVGPADEGQAIFMERAGNQMTPGGQGLVMPVDAVDKALKYMSRDKRPGLQYVAMTRVSDPARVGFTSVDIKGDPTTNASLPLNEGYPDWRGLMRSVRGEEPTMKVCVNRRDLMDLLRALESACPDKGDINPVFIEIGPQGRGMLLRCINHDTRQHAVGVVMVYNTKGTWLPMDQWENSIFSPVIPGSGELLEPPVRRK